MSRTRLLSICRLIAKKLGINIRQNPEPQQQEPPLSIREKRQQLVKDIADRNKGLIPASTPLLLTSRSDLTAPPNNPSLKRYKITYRSYEGEVTERIIRPVHFFTFQNARYLYAYCELRQGFRDFKLDRLLGNTLIDLDTGKTITSHALPLPTSSRPAPPAVPAPNCKRYKINYRPLGGEPAERVVRPVNIFKGDHYFQMFAYCELRQDYRQFNLIRLIGAVIDMETGRMVDINALPFIALHKGPRGGVYFFDKKGKKRRFNDAALDRFKPY
ncbi:MAG: WYL domain-containing protein [Methylovulum sp.]|nr:WYL domain-containing protein [Methylovulum sp.]